MSDKFDRDLQRLQSAIQELKKHWILGSSPCATDLKVGLGVLRTFLRQAQYAWSSSEKKTLRVQGLMAELRAAFADARSNVEAAERIGNRKVNEVYSVLLKKLHRLDPKMGKEYKSMKRHGFQPPYGEDKIEFWVKSLLAVSDDLNALLLAVVFPVVDLAGEIEVLAETLVGLHSFISTYQTYLCSANDTSTDFLGYLGTVVISAAEMSYKCWSDEKDPDNLMILIPDLVQKIKPFTLESIDLYLGVLMALYEAGQDVEEMLASFFKCWLPVKDQLNNGVRAGLIFLTRLLIEYPHDIQVISVDTKAVIAKAMCLCSSSKAELSEKRAEVFQLLEMIEILKSEAIDLVLINRIKEDGKTAVQKPLTLDKDYEIVCAGCDVLETILENPPSGITEKGKLLFMHIVAALLQAFSYHTKFYEKTMTEDLIGLMPKLLLNIKLLKAQVFWLDLTNRNTSFDHNIDTLIQSLECFQRISWVGGPFFARVDELASQAMSVYHSICNSRDAENLLPGLLEKIDHVKAEALGVQIRVPFSFPKIPGSCFVAFFLENLGKLIKSGEVNQLRHTLDILDEHLKSLKSFLQDTTEQSKVHPELGVLHSRITHVVYEADLIIDTILIRVGDAWQCLLILSDVVEEIKHIKVQVSEIGQQNKFAIETKQVAKPFSNKPSDASFIINLEEDENEVIRLLAANSKQRDIVSIVGMGGIGKTTFAQKLFNSLTKEFNARAQCSISGIYQKRDLLLQILDTIPQQEVETDKDLNQPSIKNHQFDRASDEDLSQELYRRLMKTKYLIFIDNLSDIKQWDDLENCFPQNERYGGKILITSRDKGICSDVGGSSKPHELRGLSKDESWTLLENRVFHDEVCPQEFKKIGQKIADGCKGLPLAIEAIAGVLKERKEIAQWEKIAEDINPGLEEDPEKRCMNILGLSYEQLPDDLKPCFLYLGAFWGNARVPVQKLLWLWIAEGFVANSSDKESSAEEVAEGHLNELISRHLIIADNERSLGGYKFCRVHDMLQTLCLLKANEENFLQLMKGHEEPPKQETVTDTGYSGLSPQQYRLSIRSQRDYFSKMKPSSLHVRSLLFFPTSDPYPERPYDLSFIYQSLNLLRVLDLETINFGNSFPSGIEVLRHLRYLAVNGDIKHVPSILAEILNLETFLVRTFFVKELKIVEVPEAIWSMRSLRHLSVQNAEFQPRKGKSRRSTKLGNLVTLSSTRLYCGKDADEMMKRFPNLRKLSCNFLKSHDHSSECTRPPVLSHLTKLESLKISYYGGTPFPCEFHFVDTLKKLTIRNCHLPANYVSIIQSLPKLKVLKLQSVTFDDQEWDTGEEKFGSLEYLKLDNLNISQWCANRYTFPKLHRLLLQNCDQLESVPYDFVFIGNLKEVELRHCCKSAKASVEKIQKKLLSLEKKFKLLIDLQEVVHVESDDDSFE